eukprot:15452599-Alexandrium_andersonii.AAC.1
MLQGQVGTQMRNVLLAKSSGHQAVRGASVLFRPFVLKPDICESGAPTSLLNALLSVAQATALQT